ncbi:biotin synthase [Pelomonas sp. SE-A7]|uniref:biotin synthase n=1 Tax=Pelomonas sp. SE-A7 TaxID=3054953 RepID=UPI00259CEAEB|nr:biotin synthase [Pelomonas sp. SE-A7]MDM4767590.1 biotin synthase [Pelomonas sp. SE-A7]
MSQPPVAPSPESLPAQAVAVDPVAVQRQRRRLLAADEAPWLHREVSRRMAERLPMIKLQPKTVLQWSAWLGGSQADLVQAYPQARQVWVDRDPSRAPQPGWLDRLLRRAHPEHCLPDQLSPGAAELLWANMCLHASEQLAPLLRSWQQALAVDGFLMFSCLGPDSFVELRPLYAREGWGEPAPPWIDMHDIGDELVQAGFADPVMDQELLTLTWTSPERLLEDLRALGGNVSPRRFAGLRGRGWRAKLLDALETLRGADGLLRARVELIYGHAFKPLSKARMAAETTVSLEQMRAMVRGGGPR